MHLVEFWTLNTPGGQFNRAQEKSPVPFQPLWTFHSQLHSCPHWKQKPVAVTVEACTSSSSLHRLHAKQACVSVKSGLHVFPYSTPKC